MTQEAHFTVSVNFARKHFSELLARVARGNEIVITQGGDSIAKLVPLAKQATIEERRIAIEAMLEAARHRSLKGLKIKDLIAEGRR